jgi:hypothetical protein
MNKLARFMEHFWLAVAIGSALAAAWVVVNEGWGAHLSGGLRLVLWPGDRFCQQQQALYRVGAEAGRHLGAAGLGHAETSGTSHWCVVGREQHRLGACMAS